MKKLSFYFYFVYLFLVSCSEYEKLNNTQGVSLDLAQYRVKQLSDVNYQLSFLIPPKKEDPIFSKLSLRVSVHDLTNPLYLDFKEDSSHLKYLNVNEQAINIIHEKEHLIISQEFLKLGVNVIDIEFEAGDLSLNRNDDYLYTLLVPDRARTLFPCLDQPNLKATYTLSVKVPKDWNVLASSHLELLVKDGVYTNYKFKESDFMSTYLFSFIAGEFNSQLDKVTPYNMDFRYRETDVNKTSVSIPEIFRLHNASLNYLQNYTGKPFPFQKIDFAAIPGFQYGGMEHTGAIQYRESTLFLDENATQAQELSRAKLIAHESAHMWFGNLVTMNWFNDVWMKEVFANFMAGKIINPLFKNINHELQFLTSHYPSAECRAGFNSDRFDIPLIAEEFMRAEIDFDLKTHKTIDVQTIFHKMEQRTLSAAFKFYCDRSLDDAHSAEADTMATYEVLKAQLDRYENLENDTTFLADFSSHKKIADFAGFIAYDKDGDECFSFGKHNGKKVTEILEKEPGYFGWLLSADFPLYTKKVLTAIKLRAFNNKLL